MILIPSSPFHPLGAPKSQVLLTQLISFPQRSCHGKLLLKPAGSNHKGHQREKLFHGVSMFMVMYQGYNPRHWSPAHTGQDPVAGVPGPCRCPQQEDAGCPSSVSLAKSSSRKLPSWGLRRTGSQCVQEPKVLFLCWDCAQGEAHGTAAPQTPTVDLVPQTPAMDLVLCASMFSLM